ncbi:MAG: 16S rRNA (guanine(966)-N(2))-methyltransferase RsmD [Betaproteobacteria bacterium]|jgi:16S rRNA (guanine966-N2)-methyltransferase|nr:16S rRNA (guanine(966)-N(2))-methyltransferase RsmD [Betaproteobacteria bacterium]MBT7998038.1 16S rRNA (guanine(966)-N(2))-methyltransferase RsmD [Betaproteobacteria bacterium]
MNLMGNAVRIIGGDLRGRSVHFPDTAGLRPTPDRVRETLFNWLGQRLDGQICLDLFAGSAALAFEAISRGAAHVDTVDVSEDVCAAIRANCAKLGTTNCHVSHSSALDFLYRNSRTFDVVFLDPPFAEKLLIENVFSVLSSHVAIGCKIYVESPNKIESPQGFREIKTAKAGRVHFGLWEYLDKDEE